MRWASALCITVAAFCVLGGRARAEEELALRWEVAPSCPDVAWARARVASHLARALAVKAAVPLAATVQIGREGPRFAMRVVTERAGSAGERSLDHATCEALAEAAALMIALAIDAAQPASAPEPIPRPVDVPSASDDERPPGLSPPPRVAPEAPRTRFHVRSGALLDVGLLPGPSVGPELRLGMSRGAFGADLGGLFLPTRSSGGPRRVAVSVWAVALRGCAGWPWARASLGGCLAVEAGETAARGEGLVENLSRRALFLGTGASLLLRVRAVARLWLYLEPGLSVPVLRKRFVSIDTGQAQSALHTSAALAARASLGLEASF